MAPVSLFCLLLGILMLFKLSIMGLVMVFFGLLFGLAVVQRCFNITKGWCARKAAKFKGLPKPWWTAADDHAYEWFLAYPDPRLRMTPEYFPYSVTLRQENEERASRP